MSAQYYKQLGGQEPDSLIVSTKVGLITKAVTLEAAQGVLKRGSLIGKTDEGEYYLMGSRKEDVDLEMVVEGILADDIDTAIEAVSTVLYITGCFDKSAIIVSEEHSVDEYERELRNLGIYLDTVL